MPKGLFLWQSEAGKYLKFRGPLKQKIAKAGEKTQITKEIIPEQKE
jgi:hypothetical protein